MNGARKCLDVPISVLELKVVIRPSSEKSGHDSRAHFEEALDVSSDDEKVPHDSFSGVAAGEHLTGQFISERE